MIYVMFVSDSLAVA